MTNTHTSSIFQAEKVHFWQEPGEAISVETKKSTAERIALELNGFLASVLRKRELHVITPTVRLEGEITTGHHNVNADWWPKHDIQVVVSHQKRSNEEPDSLYVAVERSIDSGGALPNSVRYYRFNDESRIAEQNKYPDEGTIHISLHALGGFCPGLTLISARREVIFEPMNIVDPKFIKPVLQLAFPFIDFDKLAPNGVVDTACFDHVFAMYRKLIFFGTNLRQVQKTDRE